RVGSAVTLRLAADRGMPCKSLRSPGQTAVWSTRISKLSKTLGGKIHDRKNPRTESRRRPPAQPRQAWPRAVAVINADYEIVDAGGIEMLANACAALDNAEAFAKQIKRDGLMVRSKTGSREHPLIRHELAARAFVVKTLKSLGLDVEAIKSVG